MVGMLGISYPDLRSKDIRTRLLYPVLLSIGITGIHNSNQLDYTFSPFELRLIAPPVSPLVIQTLNFRKINNYIISYIEVFYFLTLFSSFTLVKKEKLEIMMLKAIIDFNTYKRQDTYSTKKNVTVLIDLDVNQNFDNVIVHQVCRGYLINSANSKRDTLSALVMYLILQYVDFHIGYLHIVVRIIVLVKLFLKEGFSEDYLTNKKQIIGIYLMFLSLPTHPQRACSASVCNNK